MKTAGNNCPKSQDGGYGPSGEGWSLSGVLALLSFLICVVVTGMFACESSVQLYIYVLGVSVVFPSIAYI